MNVEVIYSRGKGKGGKMYAYVYPAGQCNNRSRRVGGWTHAEIQESIDKCIAKYYTPLNYYYIDGHVIASNSETNALKEYWRTCERVKINKPFEVQLIQQPQTVTA